MEDLARAFPSPDISQAAAEEEAAKAFCQWIVDIVHVLCCATCQAEQRPIPAISASALPFLRLYAFHPQYQQFLRRLGGMLPSPLLFEREMDTAEYLMQERAREQADRHERFLSLLGHLDPLTHLSLPLDAAPVTLYPPAIDSDC